MKTYLITGGAGFIGSQFAKQMVAKYKGDRFVIVDCLTYAGNKENLSEIQDEIIFSQTNICDLASLKILFESYKFDVVVNFAASTHVDNSISNPLSFIDSNIYGVGYLLECCRQFGIEKFVQISTDEVYGEVLKGSSKETDTLFSRNPYSASKLGGEQLALSYYNTYNIPVVVTRSSNNYGPNQYEEKLIPLMVMRAIIEDFLPVYGDGTQKRDWIHVEDNCRAIDMVMNFGKPGEIYNIGGDNVVENITIVETILKTLDKPMALIEHVEDRLGHDRRYCLNSSKTMALGWKPLIDFEKGLVDTIKHYEKKFKNRGYK